MIAAFLQRRASRLACARAAITMVELVVAIAILAVLLASSMKMIYLVTTHQRAAERRDVALEAVQAVAEQAGNIPWQQLTPEAANQLKIPAAAASFLPDAELKLTVSDETDPPARRVLVELHWNAKSSVKAAPVRMTTWVFPEPAEKK
jgi:type II secretory pathway pseudopilin PulG